MSNRLPLPPPGFDELSVSEQIDYVQELWDRIAAGLDKAPLHEWQRAILDERVAAHDRSPDEARPWNEVLDRVQERLRSR